MSIIRPRTQFRKNLSGVIVFNELSQLVSDIGYYDVTCNPNELFDCHSGLCREISLRKTRDLMDRNEVSIVLSNSYSYKSLFLYALLRIFCNKRHCMALLT